MLVTALPRVRGVAPMTFVGLLVFSLAPLGGSQLTRALAMTRTGSELVVNAGLSIGFILLALPTGWVAWRCLAATARAFETKRIADSEVLVNVWWVMFVSAFWIDYVNVHGWSWPPLLIALAVCVAFAVLYRLDASAVAAAARGRHAGRCSCCECSPTCRAPNGCSIGLPAAGDGWVP